MIPPQIISVGRCEQCPMGRKLPHGINGAMVRCYAKSREGRDVGSIYRRTERPKWCPLPLVVKAT